jgi:MFS family permease
MSPDQTRLPLLDTPAGANPRPRLGWTLGLTSTAYFMVILDALVVVTALPRMEHDLHAGISTLQWTISAYGITVAAGIITAAALGDRLGRRRIFVCGVALFTLASAACALAPSASLLIAARAVQGFGGATVLPLSLTILTTAFPAERRGMIVGIYGGLAGLAVPAGPLVGGAVTQGLDWHWIFWINVPLGVARPRSHSGYCPRATGRRRGSILRESPSCPAVPSRSCGAWSEPAYRGGGAPRLS